MAVCFPAHRFWCWVPRRVIGFGSLGLGRKLVMYRVEIREGKERHVE